MPLVLNPKERESIIITLEGGEGAGKTKLEQNLRRKFTSLGLRMMPTLKEPGSTPRAELIRMVLKNVVDTNYDLPISVREEFNLEDLAKGVEKDFLTDYSRLNLAVVMNQLSPLSVKHGILEYVYHGSFEGMPLDCFDRESVRTRMYRSGDSRQLNPLIDLIRKLNSDLRTSKNKTNSVLGELEAEKLTPPQQARLFLVARNLLYHNVIGPAMHKDYQIIEGELVVDGRLGEFDLLINDRSGESTVVYQGHAQDSSQVENLRKENIKAMESIVPDVTVYLDVSPEIGLSRTRGGRGIVGTDFFDSKGMDFHYKVREGYRLEKKYYDSLPEEDIQHKRIVEVDASGSIETVADLAWTALLQRLDRKVSRILELRRTSK